MRPHYCADIVALARSAKWLSNASMTDMQMTSMSLVNIILTRRSIRRYEQKPVPKDIIGKILEAGRQVPSQ